MSAGTSLRLFLAIDLPPPLRTSIDQWRTARRLPGRAEPTPNLHITLVFLGDTPVERVGSICDIAASTPFAAFDLTLDRIRLWRNGILHLAPSRVPAPLLAFQQALNQGIAALGVPTDRRRYSPHLTLARDAPVATPTPENPHPHRYRLPRCPKFRWHVDKLTLFSSERTLDGVLFYRSIAEWRAQVPAQPVPMPVSIPASEPIVDSDT